jgi:hypothetical protein
MEARQINLTEAGLYELPVLAGPVHVDVTTDGEFVMIAAMVDLGEVPPENSIELRFPIRVRAAMQWLAALEQFRQDQGLPLPDKPVMKDSMH